jgi:hypothetical protein
MSQDDFAPVHDRMHALRSQFALAVASVVDNKTASGALDAGGPVTLAVSPMFVQQLAEVAWTWTTCSLAPDLEKFAKHGKRNKIGAEDVLLAARKNSVTQSLVEKEARRIRPVRQKVGDTSRAAS